MPVVVDGAQIIADGRVQKRSEGGLEDVMKLLAAVVQGLCNWSGFGDLHQRLAKAALSPQNTFHVGKDQCECGRAHTRCVVVVRFGSELPRHVSEQHTGKWPTSSPPTAGCVSVVT